MNPRSIPTFSRSDRSIFGQWWWTIDRWNLAAILILAFMGAILVLAASPAVATRIGLDSFYLVTRHYIMLPVALAAMFGMSLLAPKQIRRVGTIAFLVFLVLTGMTLAVGEEIKGATRWIAIGPFSLQPSEFLKPGFAIVAAWMFALQKEGKNVPGNIIAILAYGLVVSLLIKQPDLGQTAIVSATWFAQFFVAGLPIFWVGAFLALGIVGLVGAYFLLPHVTERVNQFLDPGKSDTYQIDRALDAFQNGGLYGRGPGEGTVKLVLPDAHSDFVFAVAAEEFGLIVSLLLVGIFAFIVLRALVQSMSEKNLFILLAVTGLTVSFGLQALVNMASSLHLMPTKGMTLPFISYGGSSVIAIGVEIGMILGLTRRRFHAGSEL
jgi:cell division protein FtsW